LNCEYCKEEDSIVSVEESISQFKISVIDGEIHYDGTSEKMIHSEVVDYQCVQCGAVFSEDDVLKMVVKE
tara:strand:+ start:468 stop:677 length:210 start_codon:yes stop_codon:yes gene_type:complete